MVTRQGTASSLERPYQQDSAPSSWSRNSLRTLTDPQVGRCGVPSRAFGAFAINRSKGRTFSHLAAA